MPDLTAETWSDGLTLYQWVCTFVSVAPRRHEEWWLDVGAIMRLQARDPRGWQSIDPYEGEDERLKDPLFPWLATPVTSADTERFHPRVRELPRTSARSLIVLLGVLGLDVTKSSRWEERRPGMERRADMILSRFPAGSFFYSNIGWEGDRPDFYEQGVWGGLDPFSHYGWDAGLIVVNDDEVAVFWNFQNT
ncbi:hypothetical protein BX286_2119 [Streptomyces sp. 3211.6]|uniref:hypothetical protein n=1 Tax=Streptomyces sp. 3211.6 TaxID=1938845 RepID=UPI000EB0280F|nr:hypothetical protein [Streptomyces sp. 3211.6]RKT04171.1 hypothetical protein BX286_2119 [Streptomyces sp. 3211.6]